MTIGGAYKNKSRFFVVVNVEVEQFSFFISISIFPIKHIIFFPIKKATDIMKKKASRSQSFVDERRSTSQT